MKQLNDIQYILQYLHTYPDALSDLKIEDLITPKELDNQYKEWGRLYSKLEDMEKEFFKPYWLPIQRISFDYFIDLSDANYSIIEAFYYYFDEPYSWEKKVLFHSITNLLLADENRKDLKEYRVNKIFEKYKKYLDKR